MRQNRSELLLGIDKKRNPHSSPENEQKIKRRPIIEGITPLENASAYIESRSENVKKMGKREAVLHNALWPELPSNHESVIKLKEILGSILERAGLPKDFLSIAVFQSNYPDVHVQMIAKKVRVSSYFLELVKGDAEHIAAVLAHEVGHILLAHYTSKEEHDFDPLDERTQGYEHEYQADRASVILTNRLGIKPSTLADTLSKIDKDLYSRKSSKDNYMLEGFNYQTWILTTHPHTPRRVLAINRDGASLPAYPKKVKFANVPFPDSAEFQFVDFRLWKSLHDPDNRAYPDCFWEEFEAPDAVKSLVKVDEPLEEYRVNLKKNPIHKNRQTLQKIIGVPAYYINDLINTGRIGSISKPIDATPEDVASWTENNGKEISHWWHQTINQLDSMDGYLDLSDEVKQYPLSVIKLIINQVRPEQAVVSQYYETAEGGERISDEDLFKDFTKQALLIEKQDYAGSVEMMLLTSLLIREWFNQDERLNNIDGVAELCQFLRNFYENHGSYVPYTGARVFVRLEEIFAKAKDDTEKDTIAEMCKEYENELTAGANAGAKLARNLMPSVCNWLYSKDPNIFSEQSIGVKKNFTAYQLPEEVKTALEDKESTQEQVRAALALVPKNYRPKNLSLLLFTAIKEENEAIDMRGRSDTAMEADIEAQVAILSGEDFERKYFGEGRQSYIKAEYETTDQSIPEYGDINRLWIKSEYQAEFEKIAAGSLKLEFLIDTFPARSARRDVLIAEALGWKEIVHVEDIMNIQENILKIGDIPLLFELSDIFSNPLLSLTVSQRLWELYKHGEKDFFSQLPIAEKQRVETELLNLPLEQRNNHLRAILLSYKEPTYVRDELLRPLVDRAPDQASTMAIASWYCEPPPGVLRPRSGEVVAVTETLLDALRGMPQLDKQELFLYFLGQRRFYSGIDSKFFFHLREKESEFRSDTIYLNEHDFLKKYGLSPHEGKIGQRAKGDQEADEDTLDFGEDEEEKKYDYADHDEGQPKININYIVESPDSLILLTKTSGIPVDLLLQQQRLTTTRREQRDFITHLLLGNEGILTKENKSEFLTSVAGNVVENSAWSIEQTSGEKKAMKDLLAFALNNCPDRRLPDLFLGLWNLQQEKGSLPQVMTTLLRELGSLFIKAGQYLGTQSNSLPAEWIRAFRTLSDQNTRAEKTLIYEHEYAQYGDNSPFERIGEKQGEGSMAAVYKGELKEGYVSNGKDVAVKIFHPNNKEELDEDAKFLDALVKFINERKSEFKVRLPDNLADVSKNQIQNELSYDNMVKNSQEIATVLSRSKANIKWRVPQIMQNLSKSEFIVYQYAPGAPLDKLPDDIRSAVRSEVAMELLRQILIEGTYQGDPNVGNFKAVLPENPKDKIVVDWLDTDHTGRFTKEESKGLRGFVREMILNKNPKTVAESLTSFVQITAETSTNVLTAEIQSWLLQNNILRESSVENLEKIFISFLDFLADKKLVLKEQYVTLLRTLGLMKPMLEDVEQKQMLAFFAKLMLAR